MRDKRLLHALGDSKMRQSIAYKGTMVVIKKQQQSKVI